MKITASVLVAALATAACSSPQYLQSKNAEQTRQIAGMPLPLGECAAARIRQVYSTANFPLAAWVAGPGESIEDNYDGSAFRIVAQVAGALGPIDDFNWSLEFAPAGAGMTRVELRSLHTVWGTPQAPTERLFELVQDCSARQAEGGQRGE